MVTEKSGSNWMWESYLLFNLMMKTLVVLFIASLLILGTCQAQDEITSAKKLFNLMMKALVVLFIASLLILGTCQAQDEITSAKKFPMKNRHLLSDINGKGAVVNKEYSQATDQSTKGYRGAKNKVNEINDDDDSSSGTDTHRYFMDQDKPNIDPPRHSL
ncbi:Uncharacterized protein Fot_54477 [Forsythia ovata]|uniref:Uncharacterized protein n=1 Tax=Forsythia ovata TaxID=205694 RepID=A0ABD1P789_9LAMI